MKTRLAVAGLVLVAAGDSHQTSPVRTVRIAATPVCSGCRVEIGDPVIVVEGTVDHPIADLPNGLFRSPAGGFVVTQGGSGDLPLAFSSTGALVGQIGRVGSGPGEFQAALKVAFGPGDSVAVFDTRLRRITIFDRNYKFARSFRVPGDPSAMLWLPNGEFVLGGAMSTSRGVGQPLHMLSRGGDALRSLGGGSAPGAFGGMDDFRLLTGSGATGFYSMTPFGKVEVEHWDAGIPKRRWAIESPYLPDKTFESERRPFQARVSSFLVDGTTLYLMFVVPRKGWRSGVRVRVENGEELVTIVDADKVVATSIDVIDLARGVVISRTELPGSYTGFLAGGLVFRRVTGGENGTRLEVSRFRLRGGG